MKQWKNSCCLSDSEFTSLGLNLVTVFSRRCFSFLSNILSFFLAIKKKEYLVRGLGLHKPQYKISNWQIFVITRECNDRSNPEHPFVIQRTKSTAPRIKRVHSNSNRKNTFSDYEFSIFTLCSACRWISCKVC